LEGGEQNPVTLHVKIFLENFLCLRIIYRGNGPESHHTQQAIGPDNQKPSFSLFRTWTRTQKLQVNRACL
jgi:hypothetical protein